MRISLRLFAAHRELLGADRLEVQLPSGATVADLLGVLTDQYPGLGRALGSARVAVNREYAPLITILREGDEVALIPPVAGGRG